MTSVVSLEMMKTLKEALLEGMTEKSPLPEQPMTEFLNGFLSDQVLQSSESDTKSIEELRIQASLLLLDLILEEETSVSL